jgi:hypothetical protein
MNTASLYQEQLNDSLGTANSKNQYQHIRVSPEPTAIDAQGNADSLCSTANGITFWFNKESICNNEMRCTSPGFAARSVQ